MIKKIREFYGIPQSLLADYLGITRSHLSMAEIGKRSVDSSKLVTLLELFKSAGAKTAGKKSKSVERLAKIQKNNFEKLIKQKLKQNEYTLSVARRALDKLKKDNLKSISILETIEALRATAEKKDGGLIDIIEMNAEKLYKNSSEDIQLNYELCIQRINAESDFLKRRQSLGHAK
jgi:transcriptional regulator with XRE-family HTH domain